jgi:hypothetical protein
MPGGGKVGLLHLALVLAPGGRIRLMLNARELAVGLIRGRLHCQYPELSLHEINLKLLEELERAKNITPGPWSFDILHTLERISAPYMIIRAFAGTVYGIIRTTFDIDIVVDLEDQHVQALGATYPPPLSQHRSGPECAV